MRRRVSGREGSTGSTPRVVFVANHSSHLDTPTILRALPWKWRQRTLVAAAADYFYRDRRIASLVSLLFNTIPIARDGGGNGELEHVDRLLDDRWNLLLFPEGTRSRQGRIKRLRSGAALLAKRHHSAIVPIFISGTNDVMPPGRVWPRRKFWRRRYPVRIAFGDPDPPPRRRETPASSPSGSRSSSSRRPSRSCAGPRRSASSPAPARRTDCRASAPLVSRVDGDNPNGGDVKKLINSPDDVVKEALEGIAAAHGDRVRVSFDPAYIVRADAPVSGKVGIISGGGSGHEPMHGGFVGHGHARRRLPGRGLHLADARPDAGGHQGRRRRRRRAAHRQELHRRRHELRDGGRAGAGARASRSQRSSSTTTSRSRTASTRPAAAASARPCWPRRSAARRPSRARRWPRSPSSAARSTGRAAAWAWR